MVGLRLGNLFWEVGSPDFFHAFFSTISANLEPGGFGSRFPVLMGQLYAGELSPGLATKAREESSTARGELSRLPPDLVVWDIEDRSKRPPWGDKTSPDIKNLGQYFVTSDGRDLFDVIEEALGELESSKAPLRVE